MKLLLTSNGVTNPSIEAALVDLLGRPIADASALFIPTAIYPFAGGAVGAWRAITGEVGGPLAGLGWKSMGLLELTTLPSIEEEAWIPTLRETDALLVWGGDPIFLARWMRKSGLAGLLPSLAQTVYVGVSAGSIATCATFGETYSDPPSEAEDVLASEEVVFETPDGQVSAKVVTAHGLGLVNFALIPHLDHPDHADASLANAQKWASRIPAPTYAIDDQTAIKVSGGNVEVISEGHWQLFGA